MSQSGTFRPTLGLFCIGLAGLPTADGSAQEAPPTPSGPARSPDAIALPELSVTGQAPSPYRRDGQAAPRLPTTIGETPQSISVVPRELFSERAATTLREALRNVTGISLAAGEGGFSGDSLTLRGFTARTDFYIDGIRDVGQYTRDTFYIDSVEVLKGPSSILFGRGSTGGVINQTTRLPQARSFGEVTLQGIAPGGLRATSDINLYAGGVAFRLNTMAQHAEVAGRDHVFNERWGVAPSVTYGLGTDTQITLHLLHQEENNRPDFGVPFLFGRPAPVPRGTYYGLSGVDREHLNTDVLTARVTHRFDDSITLRNTFRFANYARDLRATEPLIIGTPTRMTPLSSIGVEREPQWRNATDGALVNQTELLLHVVTGPLKHSAVVGVEVARETSTVIRYNVAGIPDAILLSPDFFQGNGRYVRSVRTNITTTAVTAGTYFVDQIRLLDSLDLLVGARYDHFGADYNSRTVNQRFRRDDDLFSYRAALVYYPAEGVRTYFATGTSFNPSAEMLTLSTANANLAPERNHSYEVGASWDVRGAVQLRSALFRIEKSNARTLDPTNGTLNVLAGEQRVDGFEISAIGSITRAWNVLGSYTYLDSRILRSNTPGQTGRQLQNVPHNTVAAWTTYALPAGVTIGAGANYIGARYGDLANLNRAPGYVRFDASLAWQPEDGPLQGLRLQVNALNLGDAHYYEGVNTENVLPGAGRTVLASVSARF